MPLKASKIICVPEYPPQKTIRIGDYEIAYFVLGPNNGPPLLLCHGLAASGRQFIADANYFAERGYRTIVPDLRGHGNSTCPENRTDRDFTIPRLAADLIAILDAEQVSVTDWVGNSLGGILALSLMNTDRARLGKFICFGTAFALQVPGVWVSVIQLAYGALGTKLIAWIGAPMTTWQPEAKALVKAMLQAVDVDAVVRTAKSVRDYDLTDNGRAFDGPMLLIRGENDRPVNLALRSSLKLMKGRDNFRVLDVKGAGHVANLDQPEIVRAAIVDFLEC